MIKITTNDIIAICSLLTNLIALILSYCTYKESKYHPILTPRQIFMYKACITAIHFHNMYITYVAIIVCYIT